MIEHHPTSLATALFARKGEAIPSPAVGYVSVNQLMGRNDERYALASPCLVDDSTPEPAIGDAERPMSSLIHRHRPRLAPAGPPAPANDTPMPTWERADRQDTTIDIMRYLSVASGRANDGGVGGERVVETSPFGRSPRLKRKQLTLRLDHDAFRHLQDISYVSDVTYQSLLEAAVMTYLETLDAERAVETG